MQAVREGTLSSFCKQRVPHLQQLLTTLAREQQRCCLRCSVAVRRKHTKELSHPKLAFLSLSLMRLKSKILPGSCERCRIPLGIGATARASAFSSSCGSCTAESASPAMPWLCLHSCIEVKEACGLGDWVVHEAKTLQVFELRDGLQVDKPCEAGW